MANKVFVGNLSSSTTKEELWALFVRHGYHVQEIDVVRQRDTGQTHGIAYVTLSPYSDRDRAIEDLNGKELEGRRLFVGEWPIAQNVSRRAS